MKQIILFGLLLKFSTTIYAQDCIESKDPITNEKSVEYKAFKGEKSLDVDFPSYPHYLVHFLVSNNQTTLLIPLKYHKSIRGNISPGTEVFFKLENGEIIKLKTSSEILSQIQPVVGGVWSFFDYTFKLTEDDIGKLSSSPVVLMRFPKLTAEGFIDIDNEYKPLKNISKNLMEGAKCVLTHP